VKTFVKHKPVFNRKKRRVLRKRSFTFISLLIVSELDVFLNAGTTKGRTARPPQMSPRASMRIPSENHISSSRAIRRVSSGHVSDSELS